MAAIFRTQSGGLEKFVKVIGLNLFAKEVRASH
jgi:hypothetical protein